MKYDFTTIMDRHGKDAIAVDGVGSMPGFTPDKPDEGFDFIPMWVADMNFPACPTIIEALEERIKHPAFGYFDKTQEYYDSIIQWHKNRYGTTGLKKEYIGYENGVLGGVISALRVLASQGDNVLLNSPTYIGFTMSLKNNGFNIITSDLVKDDNGTFRMNYEDMEKKIEENNIHVYIFCSPHNPTGRVWEREEILKVMELCKKHDVFVICDQIWADIILKGNKHIPAETVSEDAKQRTVAFYAPSKTFNLAGLVGSYHVIYNKWLRDRIDKESSLCHYNEMNVLSMHALVGAYKEEGQQWCDELCETITNNVDYAVNHIKNTYEGVEVSRPQGTYMLFIDCTKWCEKHNKSIEDVIKAGYKVGVGWQDGRMFHGQCHIRLNLALPMSKVKEAFDRLDKYVFI